MQRELDSVVREPPARSPSACCFQSPKRAILEKEVPPFVILGQRHPTATSRGLPKTRIDLRQHTPKPPPAPGDITVDLNQAKREDPGPEVIRKVLALAGRAPHEPNFEPPRYVPHFLQDSRLPPERRPPPSSCPDLAAFPVPLPSRCRLIVTIGVSLEPPEYRRFDLRRLPSGTFEDPRLKSRLMKSSPL